MLEKFDFVKKIKNILFLAIKFQYLVQTRLASITTSINVK